MNRRDFLRYSTLGTLGLYMKPNFLLGSPGDAPLFGFKMPSSIASLDFASFRQASDQPTHDFVNKTIGKIYEFANPPGKQIVPERIKQAYKSHFNYKIAPVIGKKDLNGKGFFDSSLIKSKMLSKGKMLMGRLFDEDMAAITPVHHVRDVKIDEEGGKHFDDANWLSFCDISNLQVANKSNEAGDPLSQEYLYVEPLDNRPIQYRGCFVVPNNLIRTLYDPKMYCYGLPIEDPQETTITESLQRDIKAKTGKVSGVNRYFTQRYFYQGANICGASKEQMHIIYWGTDSVLEEFFGLGPLNGCGDPTVLCAGQGSIIKRPEIIPGK